MKFFTREYPNMNDMDAAINKLLEEFPDVKIYHMSRTHAKTATGRDEYGISLLYSFDDDNDKETTDKI